MKAYLNEHLYPPFLVRHPRFIRLLHSWNNMILQRNLVTSHMIRNILPALPAGSLVVDAGCGDGQHLFPYWHQFPKLHFWGIDKNRNHIDFGKNYCNTYPEKEPVRFSLQNLEEMQVEGKADIIFCIGILQYTTSDRLVLENFYHSLKVQGKLIVYSPVNGRMILPFYQHFFSKIYHYEKSQQRQRIYTPEEIREKMTAAGFTISAQNFTYGPAGIIGHEVYSLMLMGMSASVRWRWIFPGLLLILLPLILALIWTDRLIPKKNGNGMIILAEKPPL